ncbi:hypothetical protein HMPREF3025_00085 [Neisseria sp. HMSC070E12]|jgi:RHH-type rel operon transcriptional repressor/antitoxin RelB|nr:hypothetical protein HMPREF3025_00085 [Neisseria sp. HMSC070E12]
MATTNYNIRIDQNLRDRAFTVFESYGLAPAQAIKLFLNQVADTRTIPLSFTHNADKLDIPNATTLAAIQEAREERNTAKTYVTFEEAMRHLEGD